MLKLRMFLEIWQPILSILYRGVRSVRRVDYLALRTDQYLAWL